jgi:hypothetical protein
VSPRTWLSRLGNVWAASRSIRAPTPEAVARAVMSLAFTVATLAVTARVFHVLDDSMLHAGFGADEGYFMWCGWSILKGQRPYVDFMEFKPPILFLTHALALKLHGFQNLQFRLFFSYFPLGSVLALQLSLLTRGIPRLVAMALAVAIVRVWVNPHFHDSSLTDSESVGIAYFLLGVACLLARWRFQRCTDVLGGAFVVCCILSKEPFLPAALVSWTGCFLMRDRRTSLGYEAAQYLKYTAIGALVVVLALCIYMAPTGAIRAYVAMVGRYSVVYRDPAQSFCVLGGVFQPTTPMNDLVRFLRRSQSDFFTLPNLGALCPFAVPFVVYCGRRSIALFFTTVFGAFIALYAVNVSNCPWFHYFNIAFTGLFFAAIVGVDSMTPFLPATDRWTRAVVVLLFLVAVSLETWPAYESEEAQYGHRTFSMPGHRFGEDFVMANTTPDDYVFTTGSPALYLQSGRRGATREAVHLDPMLPFYVGDTDEEKLRPLYDELVKHRPKVVILDSEFENQKIRFEKALLTPFLREQRYKEVQPRIFLRPD